MTDKTIAAVEPLLAVLRLHESANDYGAVWGGIKSQDHPPRPLVEMTVGQVLDWQDSIDRLYQSEAAGAYQILEDTLRGLYREAGVPLTARYDRATQNRLALALLRRRGLDDFLAGRISDAAFALSLAKEWASLPVPHDVQVKGRTVRAGQSYYAGDGLNKAHASIEEVMTALRQIRATPQPDPKDPVTARIDTSLKEATKVLGGAGTGYGGARVIDSAPPWALDAAWGLGLFLAAAVGLLILARVWKAVRK
ncbi:hypothetical protein KZZ07_21205 [Mameliella sp. CS4]|uniref:hypothetical protein n=1 Tax=Mameliella sp. CS4 TaxID=2862329 RepID=UPI001C5EBBD8|nr:hypothetical protein [Mameliella sp. CS4]MBW4985066.1 hypothetical protein [Mameliella sp. CS4]